MIRKALVCLLMASPANGDGLDVLFQDGNPLDRLVIFNQGCPFANALFTLDFRTSTGQIVIDTAYGGAGTRDPMDVTLSMGDATLTPVVDGDQQLQIMIDMLPNLGSIMVTMDVDDTTGVFADDRVAASGSEIAGTTVNIDINGQSTSAILDDIGRATLAIPASGNACALS